jgi:2-polyprenyl-3-methyl-5-hydroxy-6-metoxy-1,4-benzoquinol methylase
MSPSRHDDPAREPMKPEGTPGGLAGDLPEDIAQILNGFRESRALLTAIELDLFTAVGDGKTAADLAREFALDPRGTEYLLRVLAAFELLVREGDRYRNGPVSARLLSDRSPESIRPGLLHVVHLWHRWSTLTEVVRTGRPIDHREERSPAETETFIAAMHRIASVRAPQLVRHLDLAGVRRLLDVGGGSGAYSIAFARANPTLFAEVFDLAPVVGIAQRHIDASDVSDRVATRIGDLRADRFGQGYDVVFLSAICHMLDAEENRDLLFRAAQAVNPGGRVIVQDNIVEDNRTEPRSAVLFALNMLVNTAGGGTFAEEEYRLWLQEAGCGDIVRVRLPGPTGLMIGRRA